MEQNDKTGERIAKVLARAGVASRRDAERMIAAGHVAVNGEVITSAALNVGPNDRITVDGKPLAEAEPARLWLYYKPLGLVTSAADEKGRDTVFDNLPEGLPRVMPVGRLDLNSEGLLLLTNDGELKRRLELPSTGWLRKYRVRVNGVPTDAMLEPLRQGISVEGERFQPMTATIDRQQGANAWLTVGLREGRNREIRRAMAAVGLVVNRLIRISYGPFRLGELEPGAVEEVRPKVLRDQLGLKPEETATPRRALRAAAAAVEVARAGHKPRGVSRVGRMEKPGTEPAEPKAPTRKERRAARAPDARTGSERVGGERAGGERSGPPRGIAPRKPRPENRRDRFPADGPRPERQEADGPGGASAARKPRWKGKDAAPGAGGSRPADGPAKPRRASAAGPREGKREPTKPGPRGRGPGNGPRGSGKPGPRGGPGPRQPRGGPRKGE